jgi:hypothetical protein
LGSILDRGIARFSKSPTLSKAINLKSVLKLFLDFPIIQLAPVEKVEGRVFYLQKLIEAQILIDDLEGIKKTLLFEGAKLIDKDLMISLIMTILHQLDRLENPQGYLEALLNHPKAFELSSLEILEIIDFVIGTEMDANLKFQLFQTLMDHPSAYLIKKQKLLELLDQIIEKNAGELMVQKILFHPNGFFEEKEPLHVLIAKALGKDQLQIADHLKKLL